jgi:hypothetical protein
MIETSTGVCERHRDVIEQLLAVRDERTAQARRRKAR